MKGTYQGTLKMIWLDTRASVFVMLGLLLGIYAVLAFITIYLGGQLSVTGLSPMHAYMFILGFIGLKETSAYALGMSVRRTDYYLAVLSSAALLSVAFGLLYSAGSLLESTLFERPGVVFRMFRMDGFDSLGFVAAWVSYAVFFLLVYVVGWNLALLHKRFGQFSLYALAAAFVLALYLIGRFSGWEPVFRFLAGIENGFEAAVWALIPLAALAGTAYTLIRGIKG